MDVMQREDARSLLLRPHLHGLAQMWRLRRVSTQWRTWVQVALKSLPQVAVVGGFENAVDRMIDEVRSCCYPTPLSSAEATSPSAEPTAPLR